MIIKCTTNEMDEMAHSLVTISESMQTLNNELQARLNILSANWISNELDNIIELINNNQKEIRQYLDLINYLSDKINHINQQYIASEQEIAKSFNPKF